MEDLDNEYAATMNKRGLTSFPSLSGEDDLLCSMESKTPPVFASALSAAQKSLHLMEVAGYCTLIKIIMMPLRSCDTIEIK